MSLQNVLSGQKVVTRTIFATALVTTFGACAQLTAPRCATPVAPEVEAMNTVEIGSVQVTCKR
jgi:hypothetical protein